MQRYTLRLRAVAPIRSLSTTPLRLAGTSGPGAKGPSTSTPDPSGTPRPTQGHATTKPERLDVQSDYAHSGKDERADASGQGHAQPIDAARMDGGEAKRSGTEGTGAFKDQVGGQQGASGGDVQQGGKTEVPHPGWTGKVANALTVRFFAVFDAGARGPKRPASKADA